MEKYKNVIKKRINRVNSFNCLALFFIVFSGCFGSTYNGSKAVSNIIRSFQVGIFTGFQFLFFIYTSKYRRALKNDAELNKLYIEENDERNRLIKDKIGGTGYNFVMVGVATAAVVAGFLNQIVFFTLFAVMLFMVIIKVSLKIHYRKKF